MERKKIGIFYFLSVKSENRIEEKMKKILAFITIVILIAVTIKIVFVDEFDQDGIYLKFSVQEEIPLKHKLNVFGIRLKSQLDKEEIAYEYIKIENHKLVFEYLDGDDSQKIAKILKNYSSVFAIEKDDYIYSLSFLPTYVKQQENLIENTKKVLEKRLERAGFYNRFFDIFLTEKTSIKISEKKFIEITIPHLCRKCSTERVKHLLGFVGYFSMLPVNDNDEVQKKSLPILDSSFVKKASVAFKNEKAQLAIKLNEKGAQLLADYIEMNILNKIAIVIDGKIYAKVRIVEGISSGSFVVDLEGVTSEEIHDFTLMVDSGMLPTAIQIEQMHSIVWEK